MYNKLFAKILDSTIWLEPTTTRIVWVTLLAAMDETGFAAFASVGNLAARARVPLKAAETAVTCFESSDPNSGDPDHDGRRCERVPGGWVVLNAEKYREIVTRAEGQAKNRERVRRHRDKKRKATQVMNSNEHVMQSEALSESEARSESDDGQERARPRQIIDGRALRRHGTHAWCSERSGFCVPLFLHEEFVGKAGPKASALSAWYPATVAKFNGQPIGEDILVFWRNEFAQWLGQATERPRDTKAARMSRRLRDSEDL